MPRPDKDEIRTRIRDAVVAEVAAHGIGATGMAAVARRARVSAGTIYLHYASKEDLLQQVYLDIKAQFHAALMQVTETPDTAQRLRAMWGHLFAFLQAQPQHFLFLELAGAAQVLTAEQAARTQAYQAEVAAVIQAAMEDGTLAPMPVDMAATLLIGPALHLARSAALTGRNVPTAEIDATFDRLWPALTTRPRT